MLLAGILPQSVGPYVSLMMAGFLIAIVGHLSRSRWLIAVGIILVFLAAAALGAEHIPDWPAPGAAASALRWEDCARGPPRRPAWRIAGAKEKAGARPRLGAARAAQRRSAVRSASKKLGPPTCVVFEAGRVRRGRAIKRLVARMDPRHVRSSVRRPDGRRAPHFHGVLRGAAGLGQDGGLRPLCFGRVLVSGSKASPSVAALARSTASSRRWPTRHDPGQAVAKSPKPSSWRDEE
jgi:hypothetical protein